MGLTQFGVCKPLTSSNPMFGVKTTFIGPRTDSRLSNLTPNIGLIAGSLQKPANEKHTHANAL
jgi:hypothetical protein